MNLPTVDCFVPSNWSQAQQPAGTPAHTALGLHHRTALTAGAIIANNAFDRAYLTHDQAGMNTVNTPLDGILEPGDYWLQLRGEEPPYAAQTVDTTGPAQGEASMKANVSMPPPPRLGSCAPTSTSVPTSSSAPSRTAPSPTSTSTPIPTASTSTSPSIVTEYEPYPIVPSFTDWRFPHNRLPSDWKSPHKPPGQASSAQQTTQTNLPPLSQNRCCLTGLRMGTNRCHLIPSMHSEWFGINGMADYASSLTGNIDDEGNIIVLQVSLHLLFDQRRFAFVPKPSAVGPSPDSPSPLPEAYALAVHVLNDGEESSELPKLYQNVAMQSQCNKLSREFLFARFAWALFPLLQNFLETPMPRRLAVIMKQDENKNNPSRFSSDLLHPRTEWMNSVQFIQHLGQRGESRNGSRRKRSSSQMTRDENDADDDAYEERWERRRNSLDSADTVYQDPDQRQLDEATRWYEECGRYAAIGFSSDDWEDDIQRGRPRHKDDHREHRSHHNVSPNPSDMGSEDMPNLPRSFTSSGSNRSLDPLEEEFWAGKMGICDDRGIGVLDNAVPDDKGPGADHQAKNLFGHST